MSIVYAICTVTQIYLLYANRHLIQQANTVQHRSTYIQMMLAFEFPLSKSNPKQFASHNIKKAQDVKQNMKRHHSSVNLVLNNIGSSCGVRDVGNRALQSTCQINVEEGSVEAMHNDLLLVGMRAVCLAVLDGLVDVARSFTALAVNLSASRTTKLKVAVLLVLGVVESVFSISSSTR